MSSEKPIKSESIDDKPDSDRTESEEPVDPTLDLTSELFDPLKALYSNTIHIPAKKSKLFDNVSIFESTLARKARSKENPASNSSKNQPSTSQAHTAENPFKRRFLPHQSRFFFVVLSVFYKQYRY